MQLVLVLDISQACIRRSEVLFTPDPVNFIYPVFGLGPHASELLYRGKEGTQMCIKSS